MKSIACLTLVLFLNGCSFNVDLNDISIPQPITAGSISFDVNGKRCNLSQPTLTLPSDLANFFGFSGHELLRNQIQFEFHAYDQKTEGQNINVNFDSCTSGYFSVFYKDSLYQSCTIYGSSGKAYMFIDEITKNSAKGSFHFAIGRAEGDTLVVTNGKFDLLKD